MKTVKKEFLDINPVNLHLLWEPLVLLWADILTPFNIGISRNKLQNMQKTAAMYHIRKIAEVGDKVFEIGPRLRIIMDYLDNQTREQKMNLQKSCVISTSTSFNITSIVDNSNIFKLKDIDSVDFEYISKSKNENENEKVYDGNNMKKIEKIDERIRIEEDRTKFLKSSFINEIFDINDNVQMLPSDWRKRSTSTSTSSSNLASTSNSSSSSGSYNQRERKTNIEPYHTGGEKGYEGRIEKHDYININDNGGNNNNNNDDSNNNNNNNYNNNNNKNKNNNNNSNNDNNNTDGYNGNMYISGTNHDDNHDSLQEPVDDNNDNNNNSNHYYNDNYNYNYNNIDVHNMKSSIDCKMNGSNSNIRYSLHDISYNNNFTKVDNSVSSNEFFKDDVIQNELKNSEDNDGGKGYSSQRYDSDNKNTHKSKISGKNGNCRISSSDNGVRNNRNNEKNIMNSRNQSNSNSRENDNNNKDTNNNGDDDDDDDNNHNNIDNKIGNKNNDKSNNKNHNNNNNNNNRHNNNNNINNNKNYDNNNNHNNKANSNNDSHNYQNSNRGSSDSLDNRFGRNIHQSHSQSQGQNNGNRNNKRGENKQIILSNKRNEDEIQIIYQEQDVKYENQSQHQPQRIFFQDPVRSSGSGMSKKYIFDNREKSASLSHMIRTQNMIKDKSEHRQKHGVGHKHEENEEEGGGGQDQEQQLGGEEYGRYETLDLGQNLGLRKERGAGRGRGEGRGGGGVKRGSRKYDSVGDGADGIYIADQGQYYDGERGREESQKERQDERQSERKNERKNQQGRKEGQEQRQGQRQGPRTIKIQIPQTLSDRFKSYDQTS